MKMISLQAKKAQLAESKTFAREEIRRVKGEFKFLHSSLLRSGMSGMNIGAA